MEPAAVKADEAQVVTSGDGTAKSINEFAKAPEAAAAAADQSVVSNYDSSVKQANQLGEMIAASFVANLEKIAKREEYTNALGILKEAGLLDGYKINDPGMTKVAAQQVDCLTKIANKESLSQEEIVVAANQYIDFVKTAEEVEAKAKDDANKLVEALNESAEEKGEDEGEGKPAAEASNDPEVEKAIKLLQEKGVL